MDVFNSALRNPLPPARKKSERRRDDFEPDILPEAAAEVEPPLLLHEKKKNLRRKHRNSHLGCGTCKKRRIKCDENLPQCFNCVKGKLHCAYLNLDAPARNALRMAQYNQNLRQDRRDETLPKFLKELAPRKDKELAPQPAPDYYPGYVPFQVVQPQLAPQLAQAPTAPAPTLIQSPYGPVVQFQPMAPAYLVQVVQPQVYYQDQVPVQMHPMMEPVLVVDYEGRPLQTQLQPQLQQQQLQQPQLQTPQTQPLQPQTQPLQPQTQPLQPQTQLQPQSQPHQGLALGLTLAALGLTLGQPAQAQLPLAQPLHRMPVAPNSLQGSVSVPPLHPASLGTSPQLPRAVLLTQIDAMDGETDVRLAPIRKLDGSRAPSPDSCGSEKVPLIQMLLS